MRPILFRHFVEGIVRIGFLYLQENPGVFHSLSDATEYVLEERIIRRLGRMVVRTKKQDFYLQKA